jgi:hypothetical protein
MWDSRLFQLAAAIRLVALAIDSVNLWKFLATSRERDCMKHYHSIRPGLFFKEKRLGNMMDTKAWSLGRDAVDLIRKRYIYKNCSKIAP